MPFGAKEPHRDCRDQSGWIAIPACDSPRQIISELDRVYAAGWRGSVFFDPLSGSEFWEKSVFITGN